MIRHQVSDNRGSMVSEHLLTSSGIIIEIFLGIEENDYT